MNRLFKDRRKKILTPEFLKNTFRSKGCQGECKPSKKSTLNKGAGDLFFDSKALGLDELVNMIKMVTPCIFIGIYIRSMVNFKNGSLMINFIRIFCLSQSSQRL